MSGTENIASIDDLLTGSKTMSQPQAPEYQPEEDYAEETEANEPEIEEPELLESDASEDSEPNNTSDTEEDEYGNKQPKENEVIRERLRKQAESLERKHRAEIEALRQQLSQQGASQQVQQAAKDFEYNPNEEGNWQQQLASFIKQTVTSMSQEQQQAQHRAREQQAQAQFESKFRAGMSNFDDFVEVVSAQPITDAMTFATRAMENPAAFLYAASKHAPDEIARISRLADPYAQMVEIGKLDERLRKSKQTTKAPRPIGRIQEDLTIPHKSDKKETIDDLIAKSETKKLAMMKSRYKR